LRGSHSNTNDIVSLYRIAKSWGIASCRNKCWTRRLVWRATKSAGEPRERHTDAAQNYVGVPNQNRFPNFLSLDSRISKDIQVNPKYAVRLSVSSFNLTNHFNPEALHANVADPAFGFFFGHRGRRFTADFDVLF
jgi:hypothetical protein